MSVLHVFAPMRHAGPGICHGIAGNAYSFLPVYRITNNPKYLYRALKFADFIVDKFDTLKRADTPYSLWEGKEWPVIYLLKLALVLCCLWRM